MGIGNQQGRAAIAAIKAATSRSNVRAQMADCANIIQRWLADHDAKFNGAERAFAESRPTQFDNFVDSLPDVPIDQTP